MVAKEKIVKPPKDQRKLFFAASYKLQNGKLKLQSFIGKDASGGANEPFETQAEAVTRAQDYLTHQASGYHGAPDGVLIFESVALVKPKKIEVEVESFPIKG